MWSAGCQQCPQIWVMSWNKHKIEYASLSCFTSTHSQQNGTGGFIATFFSPNNLGFNLACSKCVVLKVRMSVCGIVRLTSSHFLTERRKKASVWEKNLLYPIVMLILLAGTVRVGDQFTGSLLFTPVAHAAWLVATGTNPQLLQLFSFISKRRGVETTFNSCLRQHWIATCNNYDFHQIIVWKYHFCPLISLDISWRAMWEAWHMYLTILTLFRLWGACCSVLRLQDGYYTLPYLQMIMAPTIQLYHDTRYFEDLITLFIISIVCTNKSLSSSLSADNLSFHGGIQYPLPSCGRDCHAQRIHSKPTVLLECMCRNMHACMCVHTSTAEALAYQSCSWHRHKSNSGYAQMHVRRKGPSRC